MPGLPARPQLLGDGCLGGERRLLEYPGQALGLLHSLLDAVPAVPSVCARRASSCDQRSTSATSRTRSGLLVWSAVPIGSEGKSSLYRHRLDTGETAPIPGTEAASQPFFSPDGRWIGFWSDGKPRKVAVDGRGWGAGAGRRVRIE